MEMIGFWSYVHADDEADDGRVIQLAKDIVRFYEAETTERIRLFLDKEDIRWGDSWKGRIGESLSNVAFFIPVVTPRYFKSAVCRHEFQQFIDQAKKLGVTEIVLPILYINVDELAGDSSTDPLVRALKETQWQKWTDLRFADRSSSEYRRAVHALALELKRRVDDAERSESIAMVDEISRSDELSMNSPGVSEKMDDFESELLRWSDIVSGLASELDGVTKAVESGVSMVFNLDSKTQGYVSKMTVAHNVSSDISKPINTMMNLVNDYLAYLHKADSKSDRLLSQVDWAVSDGEIDESRYYKFRKEVQSMFDKTHDAIVNIQSLCQAMDPLEEASRELRTPLRDLKSVATVLEESSMIIESWSATINYLNTAQRPWSKDE